MKYLFLVLIICIFSSCSNNNTSQEPLVSSKENIQDADQKSEITKQNLDNISSSASEIDGEYSIVSEQGSTIIVNDFGPMLSITSPITLRGQAPRKWFFQGKFPVNLVSLDKTIIAEGYAKGDWLAPIGASKEIDAEDMIDFEIIMDYEVTVENTGEATLIFLADSTLFQGDGVSESVEIKVILAD